jgi:hypothetical protein
MRILLIALFSLSLLSPIYAADKLLPRPTDDEITKGEDEIQSAYGSDIKAAKTSTQKAKLAKEMLAVALKTPGYERLRLCQLARQLAVSGNDKIVAFAASAAIADRFEPEDDITDADDQFEAGQDLWREAEKIRGEARLQKQAEAAEWYNYARSSVKGLKKKIIEKRLEIEADSLIKQNEENEKKILLGTWRVSGSNGYRGDWTFTQDGAVDITNTMNGAARGAWTLEDKVVRVVWNAKAWETLYRPLNADETKGDSHIGVGIMIYKKIIVKPINNNPFAPDK